MNKLKFFTGTGMFVCLLLLLLAGCKKEAALTPTEVELPHTLPQGNHPFDQRIVNFHQQYGKMLLYKFTDREFRWNFDGDINFVGAEGDPDYVDAAIDTLQNLVFKYYNDAFLKQILPYRILLSAKINRIAVVFGSRDTLDALEPSALSRTHVAFGYANDQLSVLTRGELNTMRGELHKNFWGFAATAGTVEIPNDFRTATNYDMVFSFNYKRQGVLEFDDETGLGSNLQSDFYTYIKYITSFTVAELNSTIFTLANDPTGLCKKKYNYLVNYYKTKYNIDLQSIGNSKY